MSLDAFKIAAAAAKKEFKFCSALCTDLLLAKGDAQHARTLLLADENLDAALLQAVTVLEDVIAAATGRSRSPQASDDAELDSPAIPPGSAAAQVPSPVAQVPLRMPFLRGNFHMPFAEASDDAELDGPAPTQESPAAQVPLRMPFIRGKFNMPFAEVGQVGQSSFVDPAKSLQKRARFDPPPAVAKPMPRVAAEASSLNAKQKPWFANLPPDKFTDSETGLRAALLELLANWQGQRPPAIAAVMNGPVGLAAKGFLPNSVSLNKWVEQRLGDEVDCKRDGNTFHFQKHGESFEICRFYQQGGCTFGDRCRNRH